MRKPRVMVVDDSPASLELLGFALRQEHEVMVAHSAETAMVLMEQEGLPEVFLLDVVMPGMDGYELCRRLKADAGTADIPVIFLTARGDPQDEVKGFACGAVDYIVKPAPAAVVRARVNTHLELRRTQSLLASANRELEGEVAILESGIRGLANMGNALGKDASRRLERIQLYVACLTGQLRAAGPHALSLPPRIQEKMVKASVLYDIGKIGIPASILGKPGPLQEAEWAVMKTHAELGGQALQGVISEVVAQVGGHVLHTGEQGGPLTFLELARDMALYHHEHWDGGGYPLGLRGDAIPLCARIVGLADVYDALLSRRAHKAPWPRERVREHLRAASGRQFDPVIVAAFEVVEDAMHGIWLRNTEENERV